MGNYCSERPKYLNTMKLQNVSTAENSVEIKKLEIYIKEAERLKEKCKYSEALKKYNKAFKFYEVYGDSSIQLKGFLLHEKAIIYLKLEMFEESQQTFKEILSAYTNNYKLKLDEAAKVYPEMREYIFDFAVLLFEIKQFERSLFYFKFITKDRECNPGFLSETFNYVGIIYLELNDLIEAKSAFEEAMKYRENVQKEALDIFICNNLGLLYEKNQQFDSAQIYYEKSFSIYKKISGEIDENFQKILNSLARVYQQKGEIEKSKYFYEEIISLFKNQNSLEIASAYNNLGYLYEVSNDLNKSISFYKESLRIKSMLLPWNDSKLIITLNNLVTINMELKDYNEAKTFAVKALEIKKSLNSTEENDLFECHFLLGLINGKLKNFERAEKDLLKAKIGFEKNPKLNEGRIISTNFHLGKHYLAIKNYEDAKVCFQKISNYQTQTEDDIELKSLIGLHQCLKALQNSEEASSVYCRIKEKAEKMKEMYNCDNSLITAVKDVLENN